MVTSRILYSNYLVENNPTVTLFASGGAVANQLAGISKVQPVKQGYATGTPSGVYTGIVDKFYRVEIHTSGTGAFGSEQWRWTDDASVPYDDINWNASNLTTQNGVNVALNNGISWRFDGGPGSPQFGFGDYWLFQVYLKYGYQKGLDGSRDHEYRSGAMTAGTIEHRFDMGFSVTPTAFVMLDHNIPSNATIALKAKSTGFTDPPDTTISIPWASRKIAALLTSGAYRYWRICVTLAGTPPTLGYLRWSEIFLGSSLVFDKTFEIGFQDSSEWLGAINVDTLRRGPGPRQLEGRMLRLTYGHMSAVDQARLRTLRTWMNDPTYNVMRPFYFLLFDSDLTNFMLCHWTNAYVQDNEYLLTYSDPMELVEVIRSVA